MKKYVIAFIIANIMLSSYLFAAKPAAIETGPPLNQTVPELSVADIEGHRQTIKQLTGDKGLVLVFFRSADWCPYCKKHLLEVNQWHAQLAELGYQVAGVSYDSVDILKKFTEEKTINYPLLSDLSNETIKAFNILNDAYQPGHRHYGIPYPGIMVVDREGKLKYKYFYEGYKNRVKIEDLVATLGQ